MECADDELEQPAPIRAFIIQAFEFFMAMLNYDRVMVLEAGANGHSLRHRTRRRRSLPTGDSQLALQEAVAWVIIRYTYRHCAA